ncbi:MAG: hypothetical protein QOG73_567 [Acetobacteraceae bacterium]|nr:hypothetical protein [Acetobacteraceae bacterium]
MDLGVSGPTKLLANAEMTLFLDGIYLGNNIDNVLQLLRNHVDG